MNYGLLDLWILIFKVFKFPVFWEIVYIKCSTYWISNFYLFNISNIP